MKVEEWNRTLAVNLTSHFLLARTAAPYMRQAGGGAIVNISSVAGLTGYPFRAPYNASKWAVIGLTKSLAKELGPSGIHVNAICPGSVEGDRLERIVVAKARRQNTTAAKIRSQMVTGSLLKTVRPDDITAMALFLASNAGPVYPATCSRWTPTPCEPMPRDWRPS